MIVGELRNKRLAIALTIGLACWLIAVAWCFASLAQYSHTAGNKGIPPSLTRDSGIQKLLDGHSDAADFHLVMAIHPKCPCTRASIGELEKLIAKCRQGFACTVFVYCPQDAESSWHQTGTVAYVGKLPGVHLVTDVDGLFARELDLKTSGAVVLYNSNGDALFSGGITPSRGHQGDNHGSNAIYSLVREGSKKLYQSKVYGCSLERADGLIPQRDEGDAVL